MIPSQHIPVLKEQVLQYLITDPSGIYLDGTVGAGGHSHGILEKLDLSGLLIGIDADANVLQPTHIHLSVFTRNQYSLHHCNFCLFPEVLKKLGYKQVTGILLDLGMSSMELDTASRGFSYQVDGPLDMRFDSSSLVTAKKILNSKSESEISKIILDYGEERLHKKIAHSIIKSVKQNKMNTTIDLRIAVEKTVSGKYLNKTLARVFQAIRIAVNNEMENLSQTLVKTTEYLKSGGRLIVISYHSLEDRIVKQFFQKSNKTCICKPEIPVCQCNNTPTFKIISKKPIIPDRMEIQINSRARSAKMRIAERI